MTSASIKELRRQLAWLRRTNPEAYQDALETIFEKERRIQRAKYEASFLAFVKRAWQEVDPKPLSISWFLECICEHLQLIADGELRSLILKRAAEDRKKSFSISTLSKLGMVPWREFGWGAIRRTGVVYVHQLRITAFGGVGGPYAASGVGKLVSGRLRGSCQTRA